MLKPFIVAALFFISTQTIADQWEPMINLAVEHLKRSGQLSEIASCVGTSEAQFIAKYRTVVKSCFKQHGTALEGDAGEDAMDACLESQMLRQFNISQNTLSDCQEQFADEVLVETEPDYSALSEAELNELISQEIEQGHQALDMMLEASKEASEGTEHLITLPVYQDSQIMAHYAMGMRREDGSLTLPVATFSSSDSVEKIIAFYQQQLPNFEMKNFQGGLAIFMEKIPDEFNPLADMQIYQSIPHITIYALGGDSSDSTTIEIAYQR